MKQIIFALIFPGLAAASDICDRLGLYSFHLIGCPQQALGVDTRIPLCQQEQWKHLAWLDYRCYEPAPPEPSCYEWNCPVPYDNKFIEPISGRTKTEYGDRELVDAHYRAARESLGQCLAAQAKKAKKRR